MNQQITDTNGRQFSCAREIVEAHANLQAESRTKEVGRLIEIARAHGLRIKMSSMHVAFWKHEYEKKNGRPYRQPTRRVGVPAKKRAPAARDVMRAADDAQRSTEDVLSQALEAMRRLRAVRVQIEIALAEMKTITGE